MPSSPLFGLVLAGGASSRMGHDKAGLAYHGRSQLDWTFALVSKVCDATFVSVRPDQRDDAIRAVFPQIVDLRPGIGPIAGISAALQQHPKAAWLVVACDLPFVTEDVLRQLIERRDPRSIATAYRSSHDNLPEPLCAIWEPAAREAVLTYVESGGQCPRKFLINAKTNLLALPDARALDNINTRDEANAAIATLRSAVSPTRNSPATDVKNPIPTSRSALTVRVRYYALFREQAGRSEETIDTQASTPAELYAELQKRHPFQLAPSQLKVAVNADFRDWHSSLAHGDTVVFIPPVAGG